MKWQHSLMTYHHHQMILASPSGNIALLHSRTISIIRLPRRSPFLPRPPLLPREWFSPSLPQSDLRLRRHRFCQSNLVRSALSRRHKNRRSRIARRRSLTRSCRWSKKQQSEAVFRKTRRTPLHKTLLLKTRNSGKKPKKPSRPARPPPPRIAALSSAEGDELAIALPWRRRMHSPLFLPFPHACQHVECWQA